MDPAAWGTLPANTTAESPSSRRAAPQPPLVAPIASMENIYEEVAEEEEEGDQLAVQLRTALDLRGASRLVAGFNTWRVSASDTESDGIIYRCYFNKVL